MCKAPNKMVNGHCFTPAEMKAQIQKQQKAQLDADKLKMERQYKQHQKNRQAMNDKLAMLSHSIIAQVEGQESKSGDSEVADETVTDADDGAEDEVEDDEFS